jgi:hypothetical protein
MENKTAGHTGRNHGKTIRKKEIIPNNGETFFGRT